MSHANDDSGLAAMAGMPAFPTHGGGSPTDDPRNQILGGGITMRDWFAGQALRALMTEEVIDQKLGYGVADFCDIAESAYMMADAMLKARAK